MREMAGGLHAQTRKRVCTQQSAVSTPCPPLLERQDE